MITFFVLFRERLWEFIATLDKDGKGKIARSDLEDAIVHANENLKQAELAQYLTIIKNLIGDTEYTYEVFAEIFRDDFQRPIISSIVDEPSSSSNSPIRSVKAQLNWGAAFIDVT